MSIDRWGSEEIEGQVVVSVDIALTVSGYNSRDAKKKAEDIVSGILGRCRVFDDFEVTGSEPVVRFENYREAM